MSNWSTAALGLAAPTPIDPEPVDAGDDPGAVRQPITMQSKAAMRFT